MLRFLLITLLLLSACKKAKEISPNDTPSPSLFELSEAKLMDIFRSQLGFIVTKDENGEDIDQGDSLLFTGLAMGVVSCESVGRFIVALEDMQIENSGYLIRFNPIPNSYFVDKNMVSRDGATGALFGMIRASQRCPQYKAEIESIMLRWHSVVGNAVFLHPQATKAVMTPTFKSVFDLAVGKGMGKAEYGLLIASDFVTIKGIKANKLACYPVHLETIEFLIMEMRGVYLENADKVKWCDITSGMGLMLTDWYCDRNLASIKSWLNEPDKSPNVYMHQRCTWESPDLKNSISPRVDFLLLHKLINEGSAPW